MVLEKAQLEKKEILRKIKGEKEGEREKGKMWNERTEKDLKRTQVEKVLKKWLKSFEE